MLILFPFLLFSVQSIVIQLGKKAEVCYKKYPSFNESIKAAFVVTGEDEHTIRVSLRDGNGIELKEIKNENQGEIVYVNESSGSVLLCFEQTANVKSYIDFVFHASNEDQFKIEGIAIDGDHIKRRVHQNEQTHQQHESFARRDSK